MQDDERGTEPAGGARVRTSVVLAVCTYRRNEQLGRLLASVRIAAEAVGGVADVGVVVVDDSEDGGARAVAERFAPLLPLGCEYVAPASGNIATARNAGLEAAASRAAWVAMTDDDCEVSPDWFLELLRTQRSTGADCVAGRHEYRVPATAPAWLRERPYLVNPDDRPRVDGEPCPHAQTANALLRSSFVLDHPSVRFDPALGRLGGEDMVFFHAAREQGLTIAYAANALVTEEPVGERLRLRHYLRAAFWFGNTMYLTSARTEGLGRVHGLARGARRLVAALAHPPRRLVAGHPPELVYSLSRVMSAVGHIVGPLGWSVPHHS